MQDPDGHDLARELAGVAEGKKASRIVILDTRGLHSEIDWFVIATARGPRHAKIVGEEALQYVKREHPQQPRHLELAEDWICGDFGGVVLHVFTPEARDFYALEHLWADAPKIELSTADESIPA